jgi:mono/diheme cytochrome c family protein
VAGVSTFPPVGGTDQETAVKIYVGGAWVSLRFIFGIFILVDSALGAATPGLIASYEAKDQTIWAVSPSPAFVLKENESIHPQLPAQFIARYTGLIKIIRAGQYKFIADAQISIDNQMVTEKGVKLDEGDHPIAIDFVRKGGPARLLVEWQSEHFPLEPLPSSVLFHNQTPGQANEDAQIARGRLLAQEMNCVGCHNAKSDSMVGRRGPDLTYIGSRATRSWLYQWLADPQHFRGSAVMPVLLSEEQDLRDVASFLATLLDYRRYQEEDYTKSDRIKKGAELFNTLGCLACHDKDGASLEGLGSKIAPGALTRYLLDPMKVDPAGRMPSMLLQRDEAASLAAHLVQSHKAEFEASVKEGDAKRGQELVKSAGCLNCHTLEMERGKPVASASRAAPELSKVNAEKGCLSEKPAAGVPKYSLEPQERAALSSFLNSYKNHSDQSRAPTYAFYENVQRFNCRACHSLDYTTSKQGFDITPPLSGVGYKLREDYLSAVLNDRKRSRPWIAHRMPDFGSPIRPLLSQIVAASAPKNEDEGPYPSRELVKQGRELMGAGEHGLGCVACHTFNGSSVTVLDPARGPEITGMSSRLRREWFYRWVREPNRIQPGTAMPTLFFGKPEHEVGPVIDALWAYISLGRAMQPPPGTDARPSNVLLPDDEPMVTRCVLHGGGKDGKFGRIVRSITVGFPNLTSYVFDAQTAQLCYAWTGGYVDMTSGWSERGDSSGSRVGRVFYTAGEGSSIHIGNLESVPRLDFKAYALNKKIPEFTYTVDGAAVTERITPLEKRIGIVRSFEIQPNNRAVFFITPDDPALSITCDKGTMEKSKGQLVWKLDAQPKVSFVITIKVKDSK